jgi:protoheme IX farnesyltransferase
MFGQIFLWTPPHFWALSLWSNKDYARAKIPMMTVTAGADSTKRQMILYTLILFPVSLLPYFLGTASLLYAMCAVALSGFFVYTAIAAWRDNGLEKARLMFAYSIFYLFALFLALMAGSI